MSDESAEVLKPGFYVYHSPDDPLSLGIFYCHGLELIIGSGFEWPFVLARHDDLESAEKEVREIIEKVVGNLYDWYSSSIAGMVEVDTMLGGSLSERGVGSGDRFYG